MLKNVSICELFSFTGLFWDRTPTAGSQGRFSSSDRASTLGAPVFADDSSILSISEGNFPDAQKKVIMRQKSLMLHSYCSTHLTGNVNHFLLWIQYIQYLIPCFWESAEHLGKQQALQGLTIQSWWCVTTVSALYPSSHWLMHAAPSWHICPRLSSAKLAHWKPKEDKNIEDIRHYYSELNNYLQIIQRHSVTLSQNTKTNTEMPTSSVYQWL